MKIDNPKQYAIDAITKANKLREKITQSYIDTAQKAGVLQADIDALLKVMKIKHIDQVAISWRVKLIDKKIAAYQKKTAGIKKPDASKIAKPEPIVKKQSQSKQLEEVITPDEKRRLKELEDAIPNVTFEESFTHKVFQNAHREMNEYRRNLFVKYSDELRMERRPNDINDYDLKKNLQKNKKYKLNTEKQAFKIYGKNIRATQNKLGITDDELAYIQAYTGEKFREVNDYLRGIRIGNSDLTEFSQVLDVALSRMPRFHGQVRRGAFPTPELIAALKQSYNSKTPFIEKGFLSTSYGRPFNKNVKFLIEVKNGSIIDDISEYGHSETEILMRSGTKFKVKKFIEDHGTYFVHLEEIT